MATDGISIYATVQEFHILKDARIERISQPEKDILVLHVHGPECGRRKILININNENGRIQFTTQSFDNPEKAPSFCMLLRKHLTGSRIIRVEQRGLDRIVSFIIRGKDELHDDLSLSLIVELMGRHGNTFLINSEGMIMDCMRHFGPSDESLRLCLPNCKYVEPPSQEKLSPFSLSEKELNALSKGEHPRVWLINEVQGISRLCAQQICAYDVPSEMVGSECYEVFHQLSESRFSPSVIQEKGVLPFCPKNSSFHSFKTMSEAFESYYRQRDQHTILSERKALMTSTVSRTTKRLSRKLELFVSELAEKDSIERDRKYGELLLANIGSIQTTKQDAIVLDYYIDPPQEIRIPLDGRFSVKQNAMRYFKAYKKAKNASEYAASQINVIRDEIDYLEGLQMSLESATTIEDISEIREEMILQGYLKQESPKTSRKIKNSIPLPLIYRAPDGAIIKVGKNNLQNDYLFKVERPEYVWLHTQKMPSSHVYIETADPSRDTLLLAAEITALHSRASSSSQVPVDYTRKKDVKKPAGAKPGFVNYFNQHTIYVTPDAQLLDKYLLR